MLEMPQSSITKKQTNKKPPITFEPFCDFQGKWCAYKYIFFTFFKKKSLDYYFKVQFQDRCLGASKKVRLY